MSTGSSDSQRGCSATSATPLGVFTGKTCDRVIKIQKNTKCREHLSSLWVLQKNVNLEDKLGRRLHKGFIETEKGGVSIFVDHQGVPCKVQRKS